MLKKGIKIEFAIANDVQKAILDYNEKVDTAISKAQAGIKMLKDSNASFETALQISKNLNSLQDKITGMAKELGVDPKNWAMYNDLNIAISDIKNTQSKINSINKALSNLENN